MVEVGNARLYHGNCIDLMMSLPENSVDMILCDLPYGQINRGNKNATWDNIIPFEDLWRCYKRIAKSQSTIVLFASGMFTARLMTSNPQWWRYNLIWEKNTPTGFLDANRRPLRSHEDIVVFTPQGNCCYNPQKTKVTPRRYSHNSNDRTNSIYGNFLPSRGGVVVDEIYPRSILYFNRDANLVHPTQKPVALCEWLIRTYSNVGNMVLDNCMGSGSSGVAATNCDRRFIGMELLDKYFDIAVSRISHAKHDKDHEQLTLFE